MEYFDIHADGGQEYMVVTSIVEDPRYLYVPWVVTKHFRREADGSKWDPQPCTLDPSFEIKPGPREI
jgi:hypothetical protein